MGNEETELELSVESRSIMNRVNDHQVRKRQKRISNVAGDGEEHSMIWGMFLAVTMESTVFMGKNFQNNQIPLSSLQSIKVHVFSDSVSRQSSSTSLNATKLGRKGLDGSSLTKPTETLTESVESLRNSSGTSSQDSQRCSSAVKSMIS